jgi:hypothetical protein
MENTKYIVDLIVESDHDDIRALILETLSDAGVKVIACCANNHYDD